MPLRGSLPSGVALTLAYVLLEGLEHIPHHLPHNVAPWDPSSGIALAALLLGGWRFSAVVILGEAGASLVFGAHSPTLAEAVVEAALVLACWGTAAAFLRRSIDIRLGGLYDLFILIVVVALTALVHGMAQVVVIWGSNPPPIAQIHPIVARSWIGDVIGVMVVAPALLALRVPSGRLPSRRLVETGLLTVVTAVVLWLNVGRMSAGGLQLFFLLFLPGIWVATRFGLIGAIAINVVMHSVIAAAFALVVSSVDSVTAYQFRMLSLTLSTLFLGAAVSGRRHAEDRLREHLDRQTRYARLSTVGEMAAALAHELNQPLAATISYTRAARRLMARPDGDPDKVRAALDGAAAQAERAGMIIRTLREFIGRGELHPRPCPPSELMGEAATLMRRECGRAGISLDIVVERGLPRVLADSVQVQQVLVNLIRNAVEALAAAPSAPSFGEIRLAARRMGPDQVEIEVSDNGPGMPDEQRDRLFQPFSTTKAEGMGLGLSISRTIIEAHGGTLRLAANGPGGCSFRFTLPVAAQGRQDEEQA
ncbi:ATP-binding protein [Magnetospirillum sp. SS-4]|uniref:ATP-binding protein n=1 Tax=Magnetospirillum sp. SS-4 TaxID=2681465 RepID=UPI00137EF13A|nr:ATP-binding protein [Magnetospirillum sp. SS-4]CAA7612676.1 Two-component sensor histidine kinase [Magnetospirillum sp. SS-4]